MLAANKRALIAYLSEFSDRFVDMAIWDKGNGAPQMQANVLTNVFEFIAMFAPTPNPSRALTFARFQGDQGNMVRHPGRANSSGDLNEFKDDHGATMPVAIAEWAMNVPLAKATEIIDPFGGTGTTIIAGERLGRRVLSIELEPAYVDIAVRRWENFTKKRALLAAGDLTFEAAAAARAAEAKAQAA
jgi:hypothetical protein